MTTQTTNNQTTNNQAAPAPAPVTSKSGHYFQIVDNAVRVFDKDGRFLGQVINVGITDLIETLEGIPAAQQPVTVQNQSAQSHGLLAELYQSVKHDIEALPTVLEKVGAHLGL